MECGRCGKTMQYQYEVEERRTLFVLWHCECGHKYLERRRAMSMLSLTGARSAK